MTKTEYEALILRKARGRQFPATNNAGQCQYQTDDGRRCVIGLLIPDGSPWLKTSGWLGKLDPDFVDSITPTGMTRVHLESLQRIHDGNVFSAVVWSEQQNDHFIQNIQEYFRSIG